MSPVSAGNVCVVSIVHLEQALIAGELRLHYQPKINMRSGQVVGMEALLRWQHPEYGLLLPGQFLPQIERHDLIIAIGNWVIDQALAQIHAWRIAGLTLSVSVNLAVRQLQHPNFLTGLRASLDAYPDLPQQSLELEILESAALDNTQQVRAVIVACRDWGIGFALDDFGTGYASLSYLREIPADVLKIDRSFIADLLDDGDDLILVEAVIGLAKAFRRGVVAEGVETAEQGLMLMRLGCDVAQGFGIARPMPAAEVPGWVAQYHPDAQWSLWADIPWEMEDFPLLVAKYDHISWVRCVLNHLDGDDLQLAQTELSDHHQCRFGHWYDHQGLERYGHLPIFRELAPIHQAVHRLGPEIVRLHAQGETERARALAVELLDARDRILERLDDLQRSVVREPTGPRMFREKPGRADQDDAHKPLHAESRLSAHRRGKPLILVVDDVPTNIELLAGVLSPFYQIKFATHGARALELADCPEKPDLILLDVMMPGMDGYEVCRRLKENPATRGIPVIFITARSESADQIRGFNCGAVDYIAKPLELPVVVARVRTHLNLKLRTDLLEAQASIDALTGIPNRRRFDETFRQEWRRSARNLMPMSLLMIDVDHFKAFNDRYGHGAGDECLRQVGIALSASQLRPGDLVARYGGEEFAVILPGCHSAGAHTIAERVRQIVESLNLAHDDSPVAPCVTISLGCATLKPSMDSDPGELFLHADAALYRAKQQGRNRVVVAV